MDASAYAVKFEGGQTSVIVLNKDAEKDLELAIDFGSGKAGAVETETLHAPGLDSRKAEITRSGKMGRLAAGKFNVKIPHGSGMRLTVKG